MNDDDKVVTLHLEYDEGCTEHEARTYAKIGPEGYVSAEFKARARAARELFPGYRFREGQPYEVTYRLPLRFLSYDDKDLTRIFYRTEDGWSIQPGSSANGSSGWTDEEIEIIRVRRVSIGDEVK